MVGGLEMLPGSHTLRLTRYLRLGSGLRRNDIVEVLPLRPFNSARSALDALSGEIHASGKTALIEDSRLVRAAVKPHRNHEHCALIGFGRRSDHD